MLCLVVLSTEHCASASSLKASLIFDHGAFMNHALHVLDVPGVNERATSSNARI